MPLQDDAAPTPRDSPSPRGEALPGESLFGSHSEAARKSAPAAGDALQGPPAASTGDEAAPHNDAPPSNAAPDRTGAELQADAHPALSQPASAHCDEYGSNDQHGKEHRNDGHVGGEHRQDGTGDTEESSLLPVRMLNEFTYCPRLFHFMHVEGRWAENVFTIEGKAIHRRVDQIDQALPDAVGVSGVASTSDDAVQEATDDSGVYASPGRKRKRAGSSTSHDPADDGDEPPVISRSVPLGSRRLGITAKLDLVATADGPDGIPEALPVETKRGRVPDNEQRCYEPERVQLMAQGLLLREHGYRCDHGVLYFAGSRTRVDVPFTAELEARTLALIEQARQAEHRRDLPPPLEDSPKCNGCSLNAICLPDETLALQDVPADPLTPANGENGSGSAVRRMYPARQDALPLYVQEQGATVTKSSRSLIIKKQGQELGRASLKDVSHLVLCGNIGVTAQAVHLLCEAGIPIAHLSMGQWFYGVTQGITLRNAYDRAAQFAAAAQPHRCLAFARDLVTAKGQNQRTLLRRNGTPLKRTLDDMSELLARVETVAETDQLLGLEGAIAAHYFRSFGQMLSPRDFDASWDFNARNRRPPRDPINALLSFGYALLTKECTVALLTEGLDPWWGLYHQPRHGRPALALDLMEPFRPLVVDSAVITAVNTGDDCPRTRHPRHGLLIRP